jgi:hypothetical protein
MALGIPKPARGPGADQGADQGVRPTTRNFPYSNVESRADSFRLIYQRSRCSQGGLDFSLS